MKSLGPDPLQGAFTLHGAKVAVLGYDANAREHAHALARAGNRVMIGCQPDTTCWARACADGFAVDHARMVVASAEVVVVLVRDHEQWRQVEPHVAPGALVVFGNARALESGVCARGGLDVVLVTSVDDDHTGCRVAVHRDVTGRALVRAVAYARAAFDANVPLRVTSIETEADLELASIGERAGSLLALVASSDRLPPRAAKPQAVIVEDDEPAADDPTWLDAMLAWRSRI